MKLTERADGLVVKADSEYEKAAEQVLEYKDGTFASRLPEELKALSVGMPRPSTEGMLVEENIVYAKWGKRAMLLDLYGPSSGGEEVLPVIVLVHGGGWGKGSHRTYRPLAINLAKRGFYTIAAEYRLSGEAPIPASVFDLKACIRWVRANATEYHFNPNAIGITGGSAGGHLSALVGVTGGDLRFEGTAKHLEHSSEVNAILSFYGPFANPNPKALGEDIEGRITLEESGPDYHIRKGVRVPPLLCINELRPPEDQKIHNRWGKDSVRWVQENGTGQAHFFIYNAPHGVLLFAPFQNQAVDYAAKFFRSALEEPDAWRSEFETESSCDKQQRENTGQIPID